MRGRATTGCFWVSQKAPRLEHVRRSGSPAHFITIIIETIFDQGFLEGGGEGMPSRRERGEKALTASFSVCTM